MRLSHLDRATLISYHRLAFETLNKYQSARAFLRLYMIVKALDAMEEVCIR